MIFLFRSLNLDLTVTFTALTKQSLTVIRQDGGSERRYGHSDAQVSVARLSDVIPHGVADEKHRLRETGIYSDLIIKCGPYEHHVHRAIVCTRSEYFTAACKPDAFRVSESAPEDSKCISAH